MQIVSAERCPYLVRTYETFQDSEFQYIVMEHIPNGSTIYDLINSSGRKPLSEHVAKNVMRQLAQALKVLHRNFIMHRDIKIQNVLVSASKTYFKLCDFGSAIQLASPDDKQNRRTGTAGYYAPEIIAKKPYGLAVDIYSLGALLMVLLTLKLPYLPYESRDQYELRLVQEDLDIELKRHTSHLSFQALHLLKGMLTKEPSERLTIDQVL